MFSDENYLLDSDIVSGEDKFLNKVNNIYISKEQINILNNYGIDINNYKSVNELIFDIESYLNNSVDELPDLEYVSQFLSEYNYYNNINK